MMETVLIRANYIPTDNNPDTRSFILKQTFLDTSTLFPPTIEIRRNGSPPANSRLYFNFQPCQCVFDNFRNIPIELNKNIYLLFLERVGLERRYIIESNFLEIHRKKFVDFYSYFPTLYLVSTQIFLIRQIILRTIVFPEKFLQILRSQEQIRQAFMFYSSYTCSFYRSLDNKTRFLRMSKLLMFYRNPTFDITKLHRISWHKILKPTKKKLYN